MKEPSKILVFRQSSLGDVILTLPVLDRLKEAYPESHIDYLTKTAYLPIVQFHPAISNAFSFDKEHPFSKVVSGLRPDRYDLIIDLQANMRSFALSLMLSSAHFLRYRKRRLRREMVVRRSRLKLSVEHTVDAYFAALRPLGIDARMTPPVIGLPQEAYQFADNFISKLPPVRHIVAFCPGARHFEKRWPAESYKKVAESLLNDPDYAIIVFSANDDDFPPDFGIAHPRLLAAKNLGLLDAAALLSRCKVALTNDSGLMHLANSAGTPVLAIFGPTNPRLGFAPTLPGSQIICDDVDCSPCSVHGQRPCYQPAKFCFEKITPERVTSELQKMI